VSDSPQDELVVVGQVGRAHGVRGQVGVSPRTDDPEGRFAVGAVLATDPPERGPLTVAEARLHSGRWLLRFEGVADRNSAEALRGTTLLVALSDRPPLDDPDEFYDTDLIGLRALDPSGAELGQVVDVVHSPGADLLALSADGREVLVPFVRQIVPHIDPAAGTLTVDPPEGLFDL
jgi:16S rRNA processing protein RimM